MTWLWLSIAAFFGGGCAGVLVMALMQMAGGLPDETAQGVDVNGLHW
jgi:hypothetical protein